MSTRTDSMFGVAETAASEWLRRNRLVMLAVAVMAFVGIAYWQSFSRMVDMWSLMNYEHCWLVVPISLYVLWRKRRSLAEIALRGRVPGLLVTALLVLLWIVARGIGVQAVEFAAATLMVFAAFWAVAGDRAAEKAAFPLLLLLAAVPVGEILVEPLMNFTSTVASALLFIAGVPVFREDTFLTLPGGSFEVAEVCSGLRYLLAGSMASLAFAYVTYRSVGKRTLFVAIAAAVLVLANGVRAFIVMYVASATEMRVFAGPDHVYFGMVLFVVVFLALIYVGERYADSRNGDERGNAMGTVGARVPLGMTAAVLAVLLAGPALQFARAQTPVPAAIEARLPELPGCAAPGEREFPWSPEFHGSDYTLRDSYTCGAVQASVYVAGYLYQEQGKELINSSNRIWPHAWRRYVDESPITLSVEAGAVEIREVIVRLPEHSMLIWYWYQAGDLLTGSATRLKLQAALYALALRPQEASVTAVAMFADPGSNPSALRDQMEQSARALMAWKRDEGE